MAAPWCTTPDQFDADLTVPMPPPSALMEIDTAWRRRILMRMRWTPPWTPRSPRMAATRSPPWCCMTDDWWRNATPTAWMHAVRYWAGR
ncbi:MAG: hypothetical protein JKP95_01335 [Oceanicaulis sp.]|nr:hypothetical protein [Oceanicaulis sp.]